LALVPTLAALSQNRRRVSRRVSTRHAECVRHNV
jgi:hypothetical protein